MLLIGATKLFLLRILWQWPGLPAAGEGLIRALGSPDENIRTLAGMFLVQTSQRSRPLVEDALRRRQYLHMVIAILGDIGNTHSIPYLEEFTQDSDPTVARAAHDAIELLQLRQQQSD